MCETGAMSDTTTYTFVGGGLDGLRATVTTNVVEAPDPETPLALSEQGLWNVQTYCKDGDVFRLSSTREAVPWPP